MRRRRAGQKAGGQATRRLSAATDSADGYLARDARELRRNIRAGGVVAAYADFEQAPAQVNDSPYGLQAGVFTRDAGRLFQAYKRLEVGGVMAGDVSSFRVDAVPYGEARSRSWDARDCATRWRR